MEDITSILVNLFILFAAAKGAGELFVRLRQPPIVGEVLVGVLIGPHALGLVGTPDSTLITHFDGDVLAAGKAMTMVLDVIAELGVIILLFFVGLETRLRDLVDVGARSVLVAVLGVLFPFALGFGFIWAIGHSNTESAFVATSMVATSVGITARVLGDIGALRTREARVILGAAVVDDILALLLLAGIRGFSGGEVGVLELGLTALTAIGFVAFAALVGSRMIRQYSIHLERIRVHNAPFFFSIVLMLGLSALAGFIGLAAIIGAFLAGMMLAEAKERFNLERQAMPIYEFLVPFFFVIIGTKVDLSAFRGAEILSIALGITALAIIGKLIGGGLASLGLPFRSVLIIGTGMSPRGEVGLVVASIGSGIGVISNDIFSVVVFMSLVTTLLAPPVLVALYRGRRSRMTGEVTSRESRPSPNS
ncbi:MAG: cation:proton antiporter [Chloroflexi bacterium]|nr:cation:proton antiporter [Chloroflexota bacterium]